MEKDCLQLFVTGKFDRFSLFGMFLKVDIDLRRRLFSNDDDFKVSRAQNSLTETSACTVGLWQAMSLVDDLKNFEEATTLSSLAVDAIVRWDDVTDKLDDNPGLLALLEISQAEVDQVSNLLRKLSDKVHDRKSDLLRVLDRALRPTPAERPGDGMRAMWEAAEELTLDQRCWRARCFLALRSRPRTTMKRPPDQCLDIGLGHSRLGGTDSVLMPTGASRQ